MEWFFPIISNVFYLLPVSWVVYRWCVISKCTTNMFLPISDNQRRVLTCCQLILVICYGYLGSFLSLLGLVFCSTYYHIMGPEYIYLDYCAISICICNGLLYIAHVVKPSLKITIEILVIMIEIYLCNLCILSQTGNYYALLALPMLFIGLLCHEILKDLIVWCKNKTPYRRDSWDWRDMVVAIVAWVISLTLFEVCKLYESHSTEYMYLHSLWHVSSAFSMLATSEIANKNITICPPKFNNKLTKREEYYIDYVLKNHSAN